MLVADLTLRNRTKKNLAGFGIRIHRRMRFTQSEKKDIIRMVEESILSVKHSLREIVFPQLLIMSGTGDPRTRAMTDWDRIKKARVGSGTPFQSGKKSGLSRSPGSIQRSPAGRSPGL
jgi:hypothetical protein